MEAFGLFVTVVINYLDRSNLSITAPAMRQELGIDPARMGLIFSAFSWTYALAQIPGGLVLDRLGRLGKLTATSEATPDRTGVFCVYLDSRWHRLELDPQGLPVG